MKGERQEGGREDEENEKRPSPGGGPKPEKLGVQIAYSKRSILIDAEQYFLGLKVVPLGFRSRG